MTNFLVLGGYGRGIVFSDPTTFENSTCASNITKKKKKSSIYQGLNELALIVAIISCSSIVVYLTIWGIFLKPIYQTSSLYVWVNIINFAVTGIPIGLPITVLVGLFISFGKLRKSGIMIKNIFSIRAMNSIDVVLTDKTGTITCNSVELCDVFYSTVEIDVDLCNQSSDVYLGSQRGLKELLDLCDFCSTDESCSPTSQNQLEKALLKFVERNTSRSKKLSKSFEIANEICFSSMNKYQARLLKPRQEKTRSVWYSTIERIDRENKLELNAPMDTNHVLMVRGAPDLLLAKCKYIIKPNGGTMRLNDESRRLIEAKLNKWSLMGRRSICFCKKIIPNETAEPYAQMSKKQSQKWLNSECSELTFVGLIAFIDPPKPG